VAACFFFFSFPQSAFIPAPRGINLRFRLLLLSCGSAVLLIRGQKVMLGRELTELYGVETRALNQAVRRNLSRFPDDFMFPLTREEITSISQTVTSSEHSERHSLKFSKSVMAFTEQGVAMLSSVLRSERAIHVNIAVMRTFVKLRGLLSTHKELARKLAELEGRIEKHDEDIKAVFHAIRQLMAPPDQKRKRIGFHGKEED
jgi:hypothetical protein